MINLNIELADILTKEVLQVFVGFFAVGGVFGGIYGIFGKLTDMLVKAFFGKGEVLVMWSQTNKEFVEELVITNHNEYPYYVAHTCTYWGTGSTYGRPSFKVYFSKEPIKVVNEYTYTLSGESVCYTVNANNANQNSNEQRFNVSKQNAGTVKIDNYEFVYANAVASSGTLVPDVTATYNVKQSHFDGASLVVIMVLLGTMIWKLMKG